MNSKIENIYFKLPVFLQNIAVTLMGYKLYRERYNKSSVQFLSELEDSYCRTGVELKQLQEDRFISLARHAIEQVPYYRNWALENGFVSSDIRSMEDINRFPILEKELIRKDPESFLADNYKNSSDYFSLSTSGSTGTPLTLYCDKKSRTHHYAFFTRLRSWYGLNSKSKRATLFGRIIMLPEQKDPPFWRYDGVQKNLLMSSYHLSDDNIAHYYRKINDYQPEEIFTYPSSIYPIARYIVENNLPRIKLKLLMTTAEPLLEYQRNTIEKAFDSQIVNQYGCTEMAFFVAQDVNGVMRFHPEHGVVEVEQEAGGITASGKGELIATGLVNMAMPLIRYRVGDSVVLKEMDATKRSVAAYPVLVEMTGRTDDLLYQKDGAPVGRLDPIFKGGSNIKSAQIIQNISGDIDVNVEPDENFTDNNKRWLCSEIKKRMGAGINVTVHTDKVIKKDINGKFKAVVKMKSGV